MKIVHHGIPSGVIMPFGGNVAPYGWLLCDGSIVSRAKYVGLFNAIGTVWGAGDGETSFHLPDLRGLFLRGADDMGTGSAGRDANSETRTASNSGGQTGAKVGSIQGDAIRNITGSFDASNRNAGSYSGAFASSALGNGQPINEAGGNRRYSIDASRVVPTGADNRPKNANTNYIIKI